MGEMSLVNRYASDLLVYAREQNQLESFYTHALILTNKGSRSGISNVPDKLNSFIRIIPSEKLNAVLSRFIDISRGHLGLMDVTVVSAVPLSNEQRESIEQRLVKMFDKKVDMNMKVDKSLIGGLCIIAGHTIIDNSIKKKLSDLKKNIYKGVDFK